MKDHADTEQGFLELRNTGIEAAQRASQTHWSDYNLHDPGVTLLEQTCFALTEVSFRTAHDIRDLLTDANGHLSYDALCLFLPNRTLPGAPVTLLDLAAELAEAPQVARVVLSPGARAGLIDALIIPAPPAGADTQHKTDDAARDAVQQRFVAARPLGCDLGVVRVARRRATRLDATVQISATATPDKVAAEIYYRVAAILRGMPVGREIASEATRAMVYDRPQTYLHAPSDQDGKHPNLDNHLSALRGIPGVLDVSEPTLSRDVSHTDPDPLPGRRDPADGPRADAPLVPGEEVYPDLVLPATDAGIGLQLEVSGVSVPLDAGRIVEEHIRITAEAIAQAKHHLDAGDWRAPAAGTRRSFVHTDVDTLLPGVYRTAARRARSDVAFQQYRALVNGHLGTMNNDLAGLPALFERPEATVAIPDDPAAQRRQIDVLDYQLALQGEVMPVIRHVGLHHYRSAAESYRFEVAWRAACLARIPEFNATRGTGPAKGHLGGFLAKFRLLADLETGCFPQIPQTYEALGLTISAEAALLSPDFAIANLNQPEDPYAMLVPRAADVRRLDGAELRRACAWLVDKRISPEILTRLADARNFLVCDTAPAGGGDKTGRYAVLFNGGDATGVHGCGSFEAQSQAQSRANALRVTWADLQIRAEGAVLVEDIMLRDAPMHFTAHVAYLVLPRWTARCSQKPYQAYIARLIRTLAPAHLHIRPVWLDFPETLQFAGLYRAFGDQMEGAGPELRGFLEAREQARG